MQGFRNRLPALAILTAALYATSPATAQVSAGRGARDPLRVDVIVGSEGKGMYAGAGIRSVGVALRKGFIRPQGTVQLRQPQQPYGRYGAGPEADDQPERDVQVIYGNLPEPDLPAGFEQQLLQAIDNGQWDRVRDKKLSGKPG